MGSGTAYVPLHLAFTRGKRVGPLSIHCKGIQGISPFDAREIMFRHLMPKVLGNFYHDGSNGRHRCLVTEPMMMSLSAAKGVSYKRLFQLPVARAIAAEAILAVAFLNDPEIVNVGTYACLPFLVCHH
jgi:hypothetical protein